MKTRLAAMGTNGYQRPAVDYSGLRRNREQRSKNRKLFFLVLSLLLALLLLFVLKCRFPFDTIFIGDEETAKNGQPLVSGSTEMRKNIYDRNLDNMAVSFQLVSIYARPLELTDIREAAERLAPVLGRDAEELYGNLKTERSYEWLAKHVSPVLAAEVADLDLAGVYFSYENERFYPHNSLGAHVLGFVNDEQGLAGIESYYDARLRSGIARELAGNSQDSPRDASRPGHLVLTLDLRVQALLEKDLQKLMSRTGARQAMAALMEVDTGAIVALANLPAFDPNSFWESSLEVLPNRVVSQRIKPGPLNRLFMLAADIRDGRKSWEEPDEVEVFHGKVLRPRMTKERINGPLPMQWQRFAGNYLGSLELAYFDSETPADSLAALSLSLGFDKDRQLDLAPARIREIDLKTGNSDDSGYLFADTDTVTGLSLLTGFTWLVNGGQQVKPYLLQEIITDDGQRESLSHPYGPLAGFSGEMSRQFNAFLADRVRPGRRFYFSESLALVKGEIDGPVPVADGTEQPRPEPFFQVTLLGMGPVAQPRLSLIVVLDEAKVDLTSYPPGRRQLNRFMGKALSLLDSPQVKTADLPPQINSDEIYRRWLAEHSSPSSSGHEVSLPFERMPDLRGVSLRKALQILQPGKMRIRVHGAGRVRSQKPRPGARITGDECVLTLSMEGP